MSKANEVFETIANRIADALESGTRPWAKPWNAKASPVALEMPHNVAGRNYRGANVFWLWMAQEAAGYAEPVWMTFKQAKELGGSVRKGEKGVPVFFWSQVKKQDEKTGEEKAHWFAKSYVVFNIAQCDGIERKASPVAAPEAEGDRLAAAEALIAATGADIRHGGAEAFYRPSTDSVHMPAFAAFESADGYYSTLFHELGHWSGADSRLKRDLTGRFGDQAYAFEELIAELTAAFVCASQGFASIERADDQHAAYIGSWIKRLRHDPKAFVKAASEAQRAAEFILAKGEAQALAVAA